MDNDDKQGPSSNITASVPPTPVRKISMTTLIIWNISKALEKNPDLKLKLKSALRAAKHQLEQSEDVTKIVSQTPDDRHLSCALLAWQQLGHKDADSLYHFMEKKLTVVDAGRRIKQEAEESFTESKDSDFLKDTFHTKIGPVLKLPKIVMRVEQTHMSRRRARSSEPEDEESRGHCSRSTEDERQPTPPCGQRTDPGMDRGGQKTEDEESRGYCTRSTERQRTSPCGQRTDPGIYRGGHKTDQGQSFRGMDRGGQNTDPAMDRVQEAGNELQTRIQMACCLENNCVERLAQLDKHTRELRDRLAKLARREAERVALLERAETAWRDLEVGYIRRLRVVTEKEQDLSRSMAISIAERNEAKAASEKLMQELKPLGEKAELVRDQLKKTETEVCARACVRLKAVEETTHQATALTDVECRLSQVERDLVFKEEQLRHKVQKLGGEYETERGLSFEIERSLRAELSGLKAQLKEVTDELLAEDECINKIKEEITELQNEKAEIVEDLEGCQAVCDKGMQKKINELKNKKEQLQALKDRVLDCKCKIPVDAGVTVKRTPSLAALCHCLPEERYLEACSCTSLKTQLLSDLLAGLFSGLQAELDTSGTKMPCQLLKCLEDRHNWDRASVVKTNLMNFFAKLLAGELDIAIVNSIEKYHAKWVGNSCLDATRPIPNMVQPEQEGWERRAVELRAQRLASMMAERMFNERAEELVQKAKDVISKGPPPCVCAPPNNIGNTVDLRAHRLASKMAEQMFNERAEELVQKTKDVISKGPSPCDCAPPNNIGNTGNYPSCYPVLVGEQPRVLKSIAASNAVPSKRQGVAATAINSAQPGWHRAINDVMELRTQIADLKKNTIKKDDLKSMEKKITKLVQRTSSPEGAEIPTKLPNYGYNRETKLKNNANVDSSRPKKTIISPKKKLNPESDKSTKKNVGARNHIVNWCMCGVNKSPPKGSKNPKDNFDLSIKKCNQLPSKQTVSQMSVSLKYTKPIQDLISGRILDDDSYKKPKTCKSNCACFNKVPSCSSIDRLLETLTKWEGDLKDVTTDNATDSKEASALPPGKMYHKSKVDVLTTASKAKTVISHLPATTDSVYMGAVNLEKSYENCKCSVNDYETGSKNNLSELKCLRSRSCKCSNCSEDKSAGTDAQVKNYKKHSKESILKCGSEEYTKVSNDCFRENDLVGMRSGKVNRASDAHNFIKESASCDCNYEIKFLGVTLTNTHFNKNVTNTTNTGSLVYSTQQQLEKDYSRKHRNPVSQMITQSSDLMKGKITNKDVFPNNKSTCQCNLRIEELKNFFDNALKKEMKDVNKNNISNTSSAQQKEEKCICCVNSFIEETNDLEINTFFLLEEHLKNKLNELKNDCKAKCIQPEEENKVFTTIFKKIKNAIIESTDKMECKCTNDAKTEGSWKRAYTLLQEYIKTKINRVHGGSRLSNQNKIILPDLTDKICLLIDNDFQRLKDICKCKIPERSTRNKNILDNATFLLPEHDKVKRYLNDKQTITKEVETITKEVVVKPLIISQNTSAVIIPNFGSKSCEAVVCNENKTIDIQNEDLGVYDILPFCEKYNDHETGSKKSIDVITDYNSLLFDVLGLSPESNLNNKEIEKVSEIIPSSPLLGFTLDCSCNDKFGKCVCSKSKVLEKNAEIDKMWKTVGIKPPICKMDYIMKNVYKKKISDKVNSVEIWDDTNTPIHSDVKMRDVKSSAHDYNDIILKDSSRNINISPVTNYTSTNVVDDATMPSETDCVAEDPLEWFECASQRGQDETLKTKSVRFHSSQEHKLSLSPLHRAKSAMVTEDSSKLTEYLYQNCECSLVPICHVKMLMEDIEDKLVHSQCTCDSLDAKVCPVHSVKSF